MDTAVIVIIVIAILIVLAIAWNVWRQAAGGADRGTA